MNFKIRAFLYTFMIFALVWITLIIIVRGNTANGYISENQEAGKDLAEPTLTLVIFGFIYVTAYRLNLYRKLLFQEKHQKYGDLIKEYYNKLRRPLLFSHSIINVTATILGTIHGLTQLDQDWNIQYITGFLSLVSMIILSLSGIIIYIRNTPLWSNRSTRKILRDFHKQWIFTSILIVCLLIHTSFG